jgi:aminoglycoside phosphotransferase (APT) family kinase protein
VIDGEVVAAVAAALGEAAVAVDAAVQLSGGASRTTWAFDAVAAGGRRRPLVLQRRRPAAVGDAVAGAAAGTAVPVAGEAALLAAAARCGVPVPRVVAAGDDWLVTERVPGETIARRVLRDDRYGAARSRLVGDCGRALAAVHRLRPASVPGLAGAEPVDELDRWRSVLDDVGHPSPAFELGFRWLAANRPPPVDPVVVHGDFRLGNLVVGDDGLRAVLDWELAHVGDPREDLGWLCVRAWRFGGAGRVAGLGSVEELLDAYGGDVDPLAVRWWEALGTLKWGVMCLLQAAAHLSGAVRSVELAAIGRRVVENEHDLLALLP